MMLTVKQCLHTFLINLLALSLFFLFFPFKSQTMPAASAAIEEDRISRLSDESFYIHLVGATKPLTVHMGLTAITMNKKIIPPCSQLEEEEIKLASKILGNQWIENVARVIENLEFRLGSKMVANLLEGRIVFLLPYVPGATTMGVEGELGGYTDGCTIYVSMTKTDEKNQRYAVDISNRLTHEIAHLGMDKIVSSQYLRGYLKKMGYDSNKRYNTNKASGCTLHDWAESPEEWFAEGFRYAFGELGTDCFQSPIEDLNPEKAAEFFAQVGKTNQFTRVNYDYDGGYHSVYFSNEDGQRIVTEVWEPLRCFRHWENR